MLSDFYKVIELSENENNVKARIVLNEKHSIFAGHFPNQPVVPGVCMIQMVKEILMKISKRELRLIHSKNIKFLAMIDPEKQAEVDIQIDYQWKDDRYEVNAKIFDKLIIFFKLESSTFVFA